VPTEFLPSEVEDVVNQYPGLIQKGPGVLEGDFVLHHKFGDVTLEDNFLIQVSIENPNSDRVPALREIGGRTKQIVLKYELADVRALHQNLADGTACVCVKQDEATKFPLGSSLLVFMDNLAAPYLYGLSHYDKFGTWPWGEYSHGVLGILEFYCDAPEQTKRHYADIIRILQTYKDTWPWIRRQLRQPAAKTECVCGSGKTFGKCHPQAWGGLWRMVAGIRHLGVTPDALRKIKT
jgi:hypothetical protein